MLLNDVCLRRSIHMWSLCYCFLQVRAYRQALYTVARMFFIKLLQNLLKSSNIIVNSLNSIFYLICMLVVPLK